MSSPMIEWEPLVTRLYRYLISGSSTVESIDLPPVKVHNIEENGTEKRRRTLKHLISGNHINHSILYHNLRFHNHMPHILGSSYILGADVEQLHKIYDEESQVLEEWQASPSEITRKEWRDYLGDKLYQRAYIDFFEDELALKFDYDWKELVNEYLLTGENPLINGIMSGLAHPLIHLGYAYELSSRALAIEALAQACVCYGPFHKYLDHPSYTTISSYTTNSPLEILQKIHQDRRLDKLLNSPGPQNIEPLLKIHEEIVLEYWNSWNIDDAVKQFQASQETAITILVQTALKDSHMYDFFLLHILTASHAVRILLPLVPQRFRLSLIRQWWLVTIILYITQLRPKIIDDFIENPRGKDWDYVKQKAISGKWATDAHYVKALRAIMEAASIWGDNQKQYLAAAVRFADDFESWTGFGPMEEEESY